MAKGFSQIATVFGVSAGFFTAGTELFLADISGNGSDYHRGRGVLLPQVYGAERKRNFLNKTDIRDHFTGRQSEGGLPVFVIFRNFKISKNSTKSGSKFHKFSSFMSYMM